MKSGWSYAYVHENAGEERHQETRKGVASDKMFQELFTINDVYQFTINMTISQGISKAST